jgi:hypothetical protein
MNNQQSINKQNNKSRSPGAEFQKEFKKFMVPKRRIFGGRKQRKPRECPQESPPQAPPEALPAAGVRRRVFFKAGPWEGRICVFPSRRHAIAGRAQDLAGWHAGDVWQWGRLDPASHWH